MDICFISAQLQFLKKLTFYGPWQFSAMIHEKVDLEEAVDIKENAANWEKWQNIFEFP
jgi:hypothetical protein